MKTLNRSKNILQSRMLLNVPMRLLFVIAMLFFAASALAQPRTDSLSLQRFLDLVLAAHPTIQSADLELDVADATVRGAFGAFDPFFEGRLERKTKSGSPTVDLISAGVEVPLGVAFGPKLSAKFRRGIGGRVDNIDRTDPTGEAEIGVKVPLLQGIFTDKRRASFEKASLRPELSAAIQSELRNNLLLKASESYWDWAEAHVQLEVAKDVFDIGVIRADAIAERVRQGETAALDSIEALQEVEKRRGDVLKAQRKVESSGIKLAIFLWNQEGTPRPLNAVPEMLPSAPLITAAQIEVDKQNALKVRPEALQIEIDQRAADVDVRFASELQRPFVEAQFQALQYFSGFNMFDYKVGLSISQPLFFRDASAQLQLSQIKAQRTLLKRYETDRKVIADIDDALSAIGRALERIDAAERETKYALLVQEGERQRFLAGESTLLILNLRERATFTSQQGLITAQADYLRAVSDYLWATGKIQEKWVK